MNIKKKSTVIILCAVCVLALFILVYALICILRFANLKDTGLPRIDIDTDGVKIKSKEEYVDCTVTISGADEEYCFEGAEAGIRGRGNDTWKFYPKKPYRIKFSEKTSMFGETKNKSWVLLAMYNDYSLIKDRLAFGLSEVLGTSSYSPSYHYVELYLNGKYRGIYLLTDQVDENKGRTDVKEDFTDEDTEVPFLVELDARAAEEGEEGEVWFYAGERKYLVKYPEPDERYNGEQFEYIKSYINKCESLCRKEGVTMAELWQYIDMDSFIDFYIVEELMGQPEINWKSVFMSKSKDGLLVMGPVWDFDWSAAGPYIGKHRLDYLEKTEGLRSGDNWFRRLYDNSPEFRESLASRWAEVRDDLLAVVSAVREENSYILKAAKRDYIRWHWYELRPYSKAVEENLSWVEKRALWLDEAFS